MPEQQPSQSAPPESPASMEPVARISMEAVSATPPAASAGATPQTPKANSLSAPPQVDPSLQRIPRWLQQAERFLRVIVRIYIGIVVCLVPWFPPLWDNNPLFSQSPSLANFISHGAVRGLVSGLGLLNLWVALREAIYGTGNHPHDQEHPPLSGPKA